MTLAETIYQRSLKLPDAAAQEALDFIEFLNQRYGIAEATTTADGDAAANDAWFKVLVQQAIDDPRPGIPAPMRPANTLPPGATRCANKPKPSGETGLASAGDGGSRMHHGFHRPRQAPGGTRA